MSIWTTRDHRISPCGFCAATGSEPHSIECRTYRAATEGREPAQGSERIRGTYRHGVYQRSPIDDFVDDHLADWVQVGDYLWSQTIDGVELCAVGDGRGWLVYAEVERETDDGIDRRVLDLISERWLDDALSNGLYAFADAVGIGAWNDDRGRANG